MSPMVIMFSIKSMIICVNQYIDCIFPDMQLQKRRLSPLIFSFLSMNGNMHGNFHNDYSVHNIYACSSFHGISGQASYACVSIKIVNLLLKQVTLKERRCLHADIHKGCDGGSTEFRFVRVVRQVRGGHCHSHNNLYFFTF